MSSVLVKDFVIPNDQPVVALDCRTAFDNLSREEKLYAHHLSQAAWYGGLIVLLQTSPESPSLFSILHQVFTHETFEELESKAVNSCGLTTEEFQAFVVFTSGVLTNMGNYKGFGDSKIVPNLSLEKMESFLKATVAVKSSKHLADLWDTIKVSVYDLSTRRQQLGLGDKGITTYFSDNCTSEDADIVNRYFTSVQMEAYNNRVIKSVVDGVAHYEIRLASVDSGPLEGVTRDVEEFEGHRFSVTRGDYSPILRLVVSELEKCKEFASNATEVCMINEYIRSFTTGSLKAHKDGSRHWVKNKGPIIETYIGFIETYRDPAGMRGEFECFVAVVNKIMSAKFGHLVGAAEVLLPLLPWPATMEKDTFLKPDFTSLDVLAFSGSGIPAGINIPNYDEIRQNEGFKNVSLGNVIPASYKDAVKLFVTSEDQALMIKYGVAAFEVQVGLHELLGHGSGKLFRKNADGTFNFDADAVNASLLADETLGWYEEGETYDSKFTTISSSYEECRAECVGLYLSLNYDVLKTFGHSGQEADDVIYVNWLSLLWIATAKALEMYQPQTETWLQAHSQARFVILQVLLEAGQDLVSIKATKDEKGREDLLLSLDRSKIATVGKEAIGNFLRKLQAYKSTGNVQAAREMYAKYSQVNNAGEYPFGQWRSIIMDRKQPRKMFVQSNTVRDDDTGDVKLIDYPATHQGLIESWKERLRGAGHVHEFLESLRLKDCINFPI